MEILTFIKEVSKKDTAYQITFSSFNIYYIQSKNAAGEWHRIKSWRNKLYIFASVQEAEKYINDKL